MFKTLDNRSLKSKTFINDYRSLSQTKNKIRHLELNDDFSIILK